MAARQPRLQQRVIANDRSILLAVQGLIDYQPANSMYSLAVGLQYEATLTQAEQAVLRAIEALEQARKVANETAYVFHNVILGMKQQVIAQYGIDSPAVEAVGLVRKSHRRRPTRRRAAV